MLLASSQAGWLGWLAYVSASLALVALTALAINQIEFKNRLANALLKTILHAGVFAAVGLAMWYFALRTPPSSVIQFVQGRAAGLIYPVAFSAVLVLLATLVGNLAAFTSRLANVAITVLAFAVIYGGVVYATIKLPFGGNLTEIFFF